jgi:hypothetical protein
VLVDILLLEVVPVAADMVVEVDVLGELIVVEDDVEVVVEEVETLWPVTEIVRLDVLEEPLTWLPDCRFLVSQMKETIVRLYCWAELNLRVNEAESVPEVVAGMTAQTAESA